MIKELLKARKELGQAFALRGMPWLEYAMRKAACIELIDDERRPVADKALALWLAGGTPHLKGWLREQGADVILGAEGPVRWFDGGLAPKEALVNFYVGPYRVYPEGQPINAVEWNIFFPSGACSVGPERDSTCADAVAFAWSIRTRTVEDFQRVVRERSVERLINDCRNDLVNYNEKRQPIADAAQWLWSSGLVTNDGWFGVVAPAGIVSAYLRDSAACDEIRQASADKAQTLHMDFGLGMDTLDEAVAAGEI